MVVSSVSKMQNKFKIPVTRILLKSFKFMLLLYVVYSLLLLDGGWTTKSPADGTSPFHSPKVSAPKKLSAVV